MTMLRNNQFFFIYGNIINKTDELLFQFTPNGHTVGFYLKRQNFKPPQYTITKRDGRDICQL